MSEMHKVGGNVDGARVDYHAQTREEKNGGKRNAGEALRERLFLEEEARKATELMRFVLLFLLCIVLGSTFLIISMATNSWYVYFNAVELGSVGGEFIWRRQDWGFGLKGLWAIVEYCPELESEDFDCVLDVDQFRYHNNEENQMAVQWKGEYISPADKCGTMGGYNELVMIFSIIVSFMSFGGMVYAVKSMDPRIRSWTRCLMVLSALLNMSCFALLVNFNAATMELRELLKVETFVSGVTGPEYELGWSTYLAWSGSVLLTLGILPVSKVMQAFATVDDAEEAKRKERDKRVNQYLNDIVNTTHSSEQTVLDSQGYKEAGGAAVKYSGWTNDVEALRTTHQFQENNPFDVGTDFRTRAVEVEVPRTFCCGSITCGMTKEMRDVPVEEIKPSKELVAHRYHMKQIEKRKAANKLPPIVSPNTNKAGIPGKELPSPKRMVLVRADDEDENKLNLSMRPQSPKGPMGGTFGTGFMTSEEREAFGAQEEMAGLLTLTRPSTAMSSMSPSRPGTAVSSFGSSRPNTAMSGFRPGSGKPGVSPVALTFTPEMSMYITGANPFEETPVEELGELCRLKAGPPPLPGSPSRPGSPMIAPSGQLVAERHRTVCRAPKPEKKRQRGNQVKLNIGGGAK